MKTLLLSSIEQEVFQLANEQYEILLTMIRSPEYQSLEHGEVEQFVHQEGTELLRRLFQGHLDLQAANEVQYQRLVGSDQQPRPHHRKDTHRQLETCRNDRCPSRETTVRRDHRQSRPRF